MLPGTGSARSLVRVADGIVSPGRFAGHADSPPRFDEEGRTRIASGGTKKTAFAKMAREQKLRERRRDKQAKKDARRRVTEIDPPTSSDTALAAVDRSPLPRPGRRDA